MNQPSDPSPDLLERSRLIVDSFARLLQRSLIDAAQTQHWDALWSAPRVIVAHGTEPADFFYGNRLALELFEMGFDAFTQLPSRYSAEPVQREERARLLDEVSRKGYLDNYAGIRISRTGKRFNMQNGIVWNLFDADYTIHGQAATFDRWEYL